MVGQSDGCTGETLLARSARKKRLERKMTKDYYWIRAEENSGMLIKMLILLSHMTDHLMPRRMQFTTSQHLFSFQSYKGLKIAK